MVVVDLAAFVVEAMALGAGTEAAVAAAGAVPVACVASLHWNRRLGQLGAAAVVASLLDHLLMVR